MKKNKQFDTNDKEINKKFMTSKSFRKYFSIKFLKQAKENFELAKEYHLKAIEAEKKVESNISENVAISIQHVTKIFKNITGTPNRVLDDISFEVKKGEFHGFIGNNGTGKTTTIRLILNYYEDGYGKIFINGINSKDPKAKEKLGYIPEISVFPKNLTIYEYLYYFAKLSKLSTQEAKDRVSYLMKKYGFSDEQFKKSAEKLSSGQKKKVLLMQALLNDPDILIMDEPAANLDPSARIEFYEAVSELHKQGKTILMSSHILSELEKYIDSVTVFEGGHVKDTGKVKDKLKNKFYDYKIVSSDNEKLEELCKNFQFKTKLLQDSLLVKINTIEEKTKIFNAALKNNINIFSLKENNLSLNQIYFSTSESE
ncbi:ABC transporter ATP-binding protein [Metamycoplasma buccale]|uniref:ABC transporter ATP-binding protein n=1 Tax=Metamycoplasma buccale TaxID=55602 RepID=UPI00398EF2B2